MLEKIIELIVNNIYTIIIVIIFIIIEAIFFHKGKKSKGKLKKIDLKQCKKELTKAFKDNINEYFNLDVKTFLDSDENVLNYKKYLSDVNSKSNTLLQLGLLGTFVGLSYMIIGSLFNINISGFDIENILSGGIAFISSLFGLLFSMLLRWKFGEKYSEFEKFEKQTMFEIEKVKVNYLIEKTQKEQIENNNKMAEIFAEKLTKPIDILIQSVNEYIQSIDNHIESVKNELPKVINTIREEVISIKKSHSETMNGFNEEVKNSSKEIKHANKEVIKSTYQLSETSKQVKILLSKNMDFKKYFDIMKEDFENISSNITLQSKEFTDATIKMNDILELFVEINNSTRENNNKMLNLSENINEALKSVNKITNELATLPDKLFDEFDKKTEKQLNSAIKNFAKNTIDLEYLIEKIKNTIEIKLDEFNKKLDYSLEKNFNGYNK